MIHVVYQTSKLRLCLMHCQIPEFKVASSLQTCPQDANRTNPRDKCTGPSDPHGIIRLINACLIRVKWICNLTRYRLIPKQVDSTQNQHTKETILDPASRRVRALNPTMQAS